MMQIKDCNYHAFPVCQLSAMCTHCPYSMLAMCTLRDAPIVVHIQIMVGIGQICSSEVQKLCIIPTFNPCGSVLIGFITILVEPILEYIFRLKSLSANVRESPIAESPIADFR